MKRMVLGALALAASSSLFAQGAAVDLTYASPVAGNWRYTPTATGSEASFFSLGGVPQLTIRCTHLTRHIAISKPAAAASATLWVWTSLMVRTMPATFDATTGRVSADLSAFEGIFDAMASSRGRLGFNTAGGTPLVLPAWGDVARVVEDCRA